MRKLAFFFEITRIHNSRLKTGTQEKEVITMKKVEEQYDEDREDFFPEAQSELPQKHESEFEAMMDCLLDDYLAQEDR